MVFVFSDSHFLLLQAQSHKLLSGEKQENNYLSPSSRGNIYRKRFGDFSLLELNVVPCLLHIEAFVRLLNPD